MISGTPFLGVGNGSLSARVVDHSSTGEGVTDGTGTDDLGVTEYYSNDRLSNIMKQKRAGDLTVLYYNISSSGM